MSILLSSKRTFLLIQACGGKNFIENFIFKHKMSENVIWCKSFRLFWRLASSLLSQEKSLSLGILFSPFTLTQTLGGSKIVKEVGGGHIMSQWLPLCPWCGPSPPHHLSRLKVLCPAPLCSPAVMFQMNDLVSYQGPSQWPEYHSPLPLMFSSELVCAPKTLAYWTKRHTTEPRVDFHFPRPSPLLEVWNPSRNPTLYLMIHQKF